MSDKKKFLRQAFVLANPRRMGRRRRALTHCAPRDLANNHRILLLEGVSGLTDTDAITISMGKLGADQTLSERTAGTAIIIASGANMIMKGLLVYGLAGGVLARWVTLIIAATIAAGVNGYALLQAF
jgi:uncharacterized membrane protein (DUF4010 family)